MTFFKKPILLVLLCLLWPAARCYGSDHITIAAVISSDIEPYREAWSGFKELLKQRKANTGYSTYELKKGNPETVILKLKEEKPDIILAVGTNALKLLNEEIKDIPVIYCVVYSLQGISGANITGVSMDIPAGMKLKEMSKILPSKGKVGLVLPSIDKVGLVYSRETAGEMEELAELMETLNIELDARMVDSYVKLVGAFREVADKSDYFLMIPDSKIYIPQSVKYLLRESLKSNIPVVGLSAQYTKAGALVSFECDYAELGAQAARIAARILDGEKPSDIRPVRPNKLQFSINLKTAKRMGIKIGQDVIDEADKVFGK